MALMFFTHQCYYSFGMMLPIVSHDVTSLFTLMLVFTHQYYQSSLVSVVTIRSLVLLICMPYCYFFHAKVLLLFFDGSGVFIMFYCCSSCMVLLLFSHGVIFFHIGVVVFTHQCYQSQHITLAWVTHKSKAQESNQPNEQSTFIALSGELNYFFFMLVFYSYTFQPNLLSLFITLVLLIFSHYYYYFFP